LRVAPLPPALNGAQNRHAVIVGGGPAGSAAAVAIAAAGRPVTLIERLSGPADKVCGDFLSVEAVGALRQLGVDPARYGGEPIARFRLIHGCGVAETALPFLAFGLTRRTLDEALLGRAAELGARVMRGVTARGLSARADGIRVRIDPPGEVAGEAVFLATGKHDLRQTARPGRASGPVGWKMYYRLSRPQHAALRGCIELVLFPGGYAGLQCVEDGMAVLCLLTSRHWLAAGAAGPGDVLDRLARSAAHLQARLHEATPLLPQPLAIAGLPYGYLYHPTRHGADRHDLDPAPRSGLFRIGDQFGVIPSFTGDGVALALHSGASAAHAWLVGETAAAYHRRMRRRLRARMVLATALHHGCMTPGLQPWLARIARANPAMIRALARATRLHAA
jgi:flavin-dependent dehydrogenase